MYTDVYIYTPVFGGNYRRNSISLAGYNLESRIDNLRTKLSMEKPDVFVSHKSDDKDTAEKVAIKIAQSGLKAYLDTWDPNIHGDGPTLVDYIHSIIGYCNSLVAVISDKTSNSWWVPLEIGIAITKDLHLGSFLESADMKKKCPSYLWKWPVLEDLYDLGIWCSQRKTATSTQQFYASLEQNYPRMFRQ